MNPFVTDVLARATSQEGVKEALVGGRYVNTGAQVETYQRSTGNGPGDAWCASFVYWAISQAAAAAKLAEVPFIRSGYCPTIQAWAKDHGIARSRPEAGDAFLRLVQYPDGVWASHVGLVTSVSATHFETIEGNTNAGLSNEGDGVYKRTRPINSSYVFVRWVNLLPAAKPETYALVVNGKSLATMPVRGGRSLCPLRVWAPMRGQALAWNGESQTVTLDGKPVQATVTLIDGQSYAPVADLIRGTALTIKVDVPTHTVTLLGV